jgi:hypothetical protein
MRVLCGPRSTLARQVWLLIVAAPFAVAGERPTSISAGEAAAYVGQTKTVCGVVASSKFAQDSKRSPTFLNLDRAYPNHIFTAVIWSADRGKFKESPEVAFQGRRICVNGPIQVYRDKPEIIVTSPSQLRLAGRGRTRCEHGDVPS